MYWTNQFVGNMETIEWTNSEIINYIHMVCVFIKLKLANHYYQMLSKFEDTKGVIRIRKSKKNRQHNDEEKQRSTKHYT
jgi:hypothetical protein